MRTNAFLSDIVTPTLEQQIDDLLEHSSENFGELVIAGRLDPKRTFRFANLDGVDFSNSDIRGFDFTGASLKGARGSGVDWDGTTILDGANTEGSIFAPAATDLDFLLDRSFLQRHWTELVIWLDQFDPDRNGDAVYDAASIMELFLRSPDTFVQREALRALARNSHPSLIIKLVKQRVFDAEDKSLLNPSFRLLSNYWKEDRDGVIKAVMPLLRGPFVAEAAVFLGTHLQVGPQLRMLIAFIGRQHDVAVRKRFIRAVVMRYGEPFAFSVRDPLTGDDFDYEEFIDIEALRLITRLIHRRMSAELDNRRGSQAFFLQYGTGKQHNVPALVYDNLNVIAKLGFNYVLPLAEDVAKIRE